MLKSIQWDIYTILIVALLPALLLVAGGVTWWEDNRLHQAQCNVAVAWLEESADIAGQFQLAQTMDRTQFWQQSFEEINNPSHAGQLRWGIIQSADYTSEYYPDMPTDEPGVLNPKNGLFSRDIEEGTEELIEHCPDTEAMLADAFPMIFRDEDLE